MHAKNKSTMHLLQKLRISKRHNDKRRDRSSLRSCGGTDLSRGSKEQSKCVLVFSSSDNSGSHILTSTLNDDLLALILSFVSYAPYEQQFADSSDMSDHRHLCSTYLESVTKARSPQNKHLPATFFSKERKGDNSKSRPLEDSLGTLTHILPFVCKKFCSICVSSDVLWSEAIERLAENDQNGWKLALSSYMYEQGYEKENQDICSDSHPKPNTNISSLVSRACLNFHASLQKSSRDLQQNQSTAMILFRCFAKEARPVRFRGPVFQMRTGETLYLGKPICLHLFEPRYRLLINEAMHGRSMHEKSGGPISVDGEKPRPKFLFSYGVSLPLVPGDPAVIVELVRCRIYNDGRADVTIVPVMHCRVNSTWERGGTYRLMQAEATAAPRIRQRSPVSLGDPQFGSGPVLHMYSSNSPQLGIEFRLRLFEPRYSSMVMELTQDLDEAYRTGMAIPHSSSNFGSNRNISRPRFIYAVRRNCSPGEEALVVEVRRSHVRGGTANVTCVAIQKGTIEKVEESPNTRQAAKVTVRIRESLESI